MAFDPLSCLGGVFMVGMTRRGDSDQTHPFWLRSIAGIATALLVATVSGVASGFVSAQVVLREHAVKIEKLEERQVEDRVMLRDSVRDVSNRLRDVEMRKFK